VSHVQRYVEIDAATVHEQAHHGWNVKSLEATRLFADVVEMGDADAVRAFLEEGASANARIGKSSILYRARKGEIFKLLISAGADVNAFSEIYGSPLMVAAELGDVESIQALLNAGAKVEIGHDDCTPLMKAASDGNVEAVKTLLASGANPNRRDDQHSNALDYARRGLNTAEHEKYEDLSSEPIDLTKFTKTIEVLLAAGAEDNKSDRKSDSHRR